MLTFPAEKLTELKQWLKEQFIEFKPGAGSYQLIRIQTLKKGFYSIYQSPHDSKIFLVPKELESTINSFFARKK